MAMKTCPSCGGENHEDATACLHCHADLPGAPSNSEVAASQAPPPPIISQEKQMMVEPKTNGLATAALYLGIASIIFIVLTGIVGLILGIIAAVQIKCSGGRQKGMGMAIAGIICSVILSLLSMNIYYVQLTRWSHRRAPQVQCVRNQQQIATLVMIYAQEHDGYLPSGDFFGALKADPSVLRCYYSVSDIGYGYNGNLRGVNSAKVINPVGTLLISEGKGEAFTKLDDIEKRHNGMFNACFLDGHMEKYSTTEMVTLDVHLKQ